MPRRKDSVLPRKLATASQVAEFLDVSEGTLKNWRYRGVGPKYSLLERHVRYAWTDVEDYLAKRAKAGALPDEVA